MKKTMKKTLALILSLIMVISCFSGIITGVQATGVSPIAGDINGDENVNNKDLTRLMKYLAGEDVEVVTVTLDTNGDENVNNKDLTRLMAYLAGDPDKPLAPIITGCTHVKEAVAAVEATCTKEGNIAYWYCADCDKYFSDAEGALEITLEETSIEKLKHTIVTIPGYPATTTNTGLTDGAKCSACGTITKPQEIIPISEYEIVYDISDDDVYLDGLEMEGKIINPNLHSYSTDEGLTLSNITGVAGYTFDGWYTSFGTNGRLVEKIEPGTTGKITLYAKWTRKPQKAYFESDLKQPTKMSVEYYIDEGSEPFEILDYDGYIFVGWSDDNGNILTKAPVGTAGPVTYKANWLSKRNQAWAKQDIGEPFVYEDENVILFAYEIGEIRNVPLYTICDFGHINASGIDQTVTYTHSSSVEKELMETYTSTVSKATTDSFAWTLSSAWSESTSVDEEWAKQNGMTVKEAEEICKTDSNEWYVSSGSSGTDTTVTLDTSDDYDLKTTTKNTKKYNTKDEEKRQDFSAGLNADFKTTSGLSAKVGDLGASKERSLGLGLDVKYENGITTQTKTGTEKDSGSSNQDGSITHTGTTKTNSSSWNSESGYSGSSSVAQTNSITTELSEIISNKTAYGKEYINSEDESVSQGTESTSTNTEEYASTVTYKHTVTETVTAEYTTNETVTGYHRWVMAGIAHVFGIVGYDIKTQSYFVQSLSIMDDTMYRYEDYSKNAPEYDDYQTSYLPFSAPTDIVNYVADRTHSSDGLQVSKSGTITGYTGTDTFVVVPEYYVQTNVVDGSKTVTKITGVLDTAFDEKKDSITAIVLSDFITEIPDNCFEGYTALLSVDGKGVNKIGKNAFAGCERLKACSLNSNVTSLGENAFEGLDYLNITVSNKAVLETALKSGAKEIVITVSDDCTDLENVELAIPNTVEKITFNGNDKELNNVIIISDAQETIVNRVKLTSTGKAPLQISSPEITLSEVSTTAPTIAFISSAPTANISLYGESYIGDSNKDAVLCKNIVLSAIDNSIYSVLHVSGNTLICGEIEGRNPYYSFTNGRILTISEDEFEKYKQGTMEITFDANGGSATETTKTVYYNQTYGELPVLERDYYTFLGWFTEKDGGTEVVSETIVSTFEPHTLYAHWEQNPASGWVKESELPSGAQLVDEKWTYDLTTTTTSSSSTMDGWTLYDTQRTSWGSKVGPVYSDPSNGSRNVWSEQYVSSTTTHYKYYHRYNGSGLWSTDALAGSWARHTIDLTYSLGNGYYASDYNIQFKGSYKCPTCGATNMWVPDGTYTENHYSTRWYYQEPVYTYYFTKTESLESSTEVTASDSISDVQRWVKYREK